jgi:hypothetical protein
MNAPNRNFGASDWLRSTDHLSEIASILAAGLMRLRAKQSSELSAVRENSSVDFSAYQSGHAVQIAVTENV